MSKRWSLLALFGLLLVMAVFLVGSVMAQDAMPSLSELQPGWNMLSPGGETTCALGDPFRFFVHPGSANKLMILFESGDVCWVEADCRGLMDNTSIDYYFNVPEDDWRTFVVMGESGPQFRENEGYLQFDDPESPFADYTVVHIPHCTADIHLGDNVMTFGEGDDALTVQFNGFNNATAALEWTYANIESPERIVVTGCNIGAIGSLFHVPRILDHYSGVPYVQLNDQMKAEPSDVGEIEAIWQTKRLISDIPAFEHLAANELNGVNIFQAVASFYPQAVFAEVNTLYHPEMPDRDTIFFPVMEEYHTNLPNFRSFIGWGDGDCILNDGEFYMHMVDGLRLRDWVAALAAGEDVDNVQCTDCVRQELFER